MDVALWMSPAVLSHKLEARDERNPEAAWNVARLPAGLGRPDELDRLFIASEGRWVGYFVLSKEALWSPDDPAAPCTILFDTRTWTPTPRAAVRRFRGLRALQPEELAALDLKPR